MKRRFLLLFVTVVLAVACAPTPPERAPLPRVEEVLEPAAACTFLIGEPGGVLVNDVIDDSAADGLLLVGDVIVAVDAEPTPDSNALLASLADKSPGDAVEIDYLRNNAETTGTLTLGADPAQPGRPLMGVMIRTRYQTILAEEAPTDLAPTAATRPVSIGEMIYLLDPLTGEWAKTDATVEDDVDWIAASSSVYRLDEGDLVNMISSEVIPHDAPDGWEPLRVIGSIGPDLIIVVSQPAAGSSETVRLAISRFDPQAGATVWVEPVVDAFGLPISALGSPDGETMVVVGVSEDGTQLTGIDLRDGDGADLDSEELVSLGTPVGWMDDRTLLFRTSNETATRVEAATGSTEEVTLDPAVAGLPLFPVGDGHNVLAVDGQSLILDDLDRDEEVRILAENCPIGRIGDPRWQEG
ncbi:MAG TPA: PDZ domain-containing protein [Acidimicrobiia bacterium]|nr:PDZ domain-containing protein [Acidimicrobiia bacterium]